MQVVLGRQLDSLAVGISEVEQPENANDETFITAIAIVDEHVRRMQATVAASGTIAVAASGTIIMQQLTTLYARKSKEQLGEQKLILQFIQCDAQNIHNAVSKALACNDIPSLLVPYSGISPRSAAPQQNQPSWQLEPCSNGEVFFEPADLQAAPPSALGLLSKLLSFFMRSWWMSIRIASSP